MKTTKKLLSSLIALAIVISALGTILFPAVVFADSSFDDVVWKNIHTEDFEGTGGHKWWGCFDDDSGNIYRVSTPSGKTNDTGDSLGSQVVRIPSSSKALRFLNVVTDASKTFYAGTADEVDGGNPYLKAGYTESQLGMVRISLNIMREVTDRRANIELVGKKNGEVIKQDRTVGFHSDGKIYINGTSQEYGRRSMGDYTANKWYKIVMMINCATDTYKVGITSGSELTWLDEDGLDEDFDCILGINIRAYKEGTSTSKITWVDNIAFDLPCETYSVTLNTNGGTINSNNVTSYTETVGATLPTSYDISKPGSTFDGWYDNSGLLGTPVTAISSSETGNKTYWAKWLNQCSVNLYVNGGTINSGNVTSYQEGTAVQLPTNITREGCTFGGWYAEKDCSGTAVTEIPASATGNKTYYAKWTATQLDRNVFKEPFEAGWGAGWSTYFTESASGERSVPGEVNYTNNLTGENLVATVKRIAHGRNSNGNAMTRTLELNATASPLYSTYNDKADIVRISFDIAGDTTDSNYPTHIRLVGQSGGETVTTTTDYGDNRFILISGNRIYAHDENSSNDGLVENLHSFAANKWYKIVVEINCITDTYDIYIYEGNEYDGKFGTGFKLGTDFDKIYGISVTGLGKNGSSSQVVKQVFVDNIRYFIPGKAERVRVENINDVMPTSAFQTFTANDASTLSGATPGDGKTVDYTKPYMVCFGTNDYDVETAPDKYGMAVIKDGAFAGCYEAKSVSAGGKYGILIFGLDPSATYTMKNAVKYNTDGGSWIYATK